MWSQKEDVESLSSTAETVNATSKSTKTPPRRSGDRRTHRACDRCRVKKSKCNGQQPCNTCKANERTCVFSALRRRDIRKWHCHMQDTIDEAIQRLYRACRDSSSFPGIPPDEKDGYVTTESILRGMGFSNLDLGPRVAGQVASGRFQILPQPTQLPDDLHAERDRYLRRGNCSNNGSATTTSSVVCADPSQPHIPPYDMYHPSSHDSCQLSSPAPLSTAEQFQEIMGEQTSPHVLHSHHHYLNESMQVHHHQMPGPQQHQIHPDQIRHQSTAHQPLVPSPSTHELIRSRSTLGYAEQHLPHPYYLSGTEPFATPQQVWSEQHEVTTIS